MRTDAWVRPSVKQPLAQQEFRKPFRKRLLSSNVCIQNTYSLSPLIRVSHGADARVRLIERKSLKFTKLFWKLLDLQHKHTTADVHRASCAWVLHEDTPGYTK